MKLPQLRKKRQGFTLIELLTVIAIIGILAGALSVVVPLVKKRAAQNDAMNNCRSIAVAYQAYASSGTVAKSIPIEQAQRVTDWAVYLAKKTDMNEGRLWFIVSDDALAGLTATPTQIINPVTKVVDPDFASAKPKSWAVVAGAPRNADSNYPILWTRGLPMSGENWNQKSPWNGTGGHIGFAAGNVAWFSSLTDGNDKGVLFGYASKQPTMNMQDALGTNAKAVEDPQ